MKLRNRMTINRRRVSATLGAIAAFLCTTARAQTPSSATIKIPDLICSFQAVWQIPSNTTSLLLVKEFDACSPQLYLRLMTGTHVRTLSVVEPAGSDLKAFNLAFTDLMVTSYSVGSAGTTEEAVWLSFKSESLAAAETAVLSIPKDTSAVTIPALGCSFSPISWSFGGYEPLAGHGSATANPLAVRRTADSCSLALSLANSAKQKLSSVTLVTQPTTGGAPLVKIVLTGVTLSNYATSKPGSGPVMETLDLDYDQITIANVPGNSTAGWNLLTQRAN